MLEAGRLDMELQVAVTDRPFFRDFGLIHPVAAAARGAVIVGIGSAPGVRFFRKGPYDLRVRPAQHDVAPTFQLLAAPRIYQFVVYPILGYIHVRHIPSLGMFDSL